MHPRLAQLVSAVFHPLLMPTLLYAVVFFCAPAAVSPPNAAFTPQYRLLLLTGIGIATLVLPGLFIYILYQFNVIGSLHLDGQRDRTLPFFLTALTYGLFTYFFALRLSSLYAVYLILGSITVAIALVAVINLFWKISAHSVGVGGALGSLLAIQRHYPETALLYPILVTLLATGAVMTARLVLGAHRPAQVWAGCALGLAVSGAAFYFLVNPT